MKKLKELIWNIFFKNDEQFVYDRLYLDEDLKQCVIDKTIFYEENVKLKQENNVLQSKISLQEKEIDVLVNGDKLEQYWNNKRLKSLILFKIRPDPKGGKNNVSIDPRIFFQNDGTITKVSGSGYDDIANKCLKFVNMNIKYTKDEKEYWQFAYETEKRGFGDCEDFSILLANMMMLSGIPYWRIRLNAGKVEGGGHAWVSYLREKDNEWYVLDGTYWFKESKDFGKLWKDAEKYLEIWASWNAKYVFGDLSKMEEDHNG